MAPLLLPCAPTTAPCSEPDRLRNALISPARRQPPKTSHACLKPQQRGGVPRGRDGGAGTCKAPGMPGRCQAGNPSPCTTIALGWGIPGCGKGHGQWWDKARQLRRAPRGTDSLSSAVYLYDAKHQVTGCVRYYRTKAGGRFYSSHTSYLCLLGRKEPFVWKQQLLPQKHARGVCACKSPHYVQM